MGSDVETGAGSALFTEGSSVSSVGGRGDGADCIGQLCELSGLLEGEGTTAAGSPATIVVYSGDLKASTSEVGGGDVGVGGVGLAVGGLRRD